MSTDTPPAFDRYDPLGLDASLSPDELAVRDTVRQFCAEHVTPFVTEWFEDGDLPVARELAKQFGQLGLLGMHLHGYGCGGSSAVHYGLACLELEAADSGIRSLVSVQGSLAMFAIWHHGSEEQKQQWLPGMAAGELVGCFGLTEPDAGSDPAAMKTRARRDGSDWLLDGRKMWITNGSVADVAIVWAGTDEGIRGFVVPTDAPGFAANTIHHKLSLRARSPASWCSTASGCPQKRCCPTLLDSGRRWRACPRRVTESPGAQWARRARRGSPRWTIRCSAPNSVVPSPDSS